VRSGPNIGTLVGLRLVQGFFNAAAAVVALAVIRDRFDGADAARLLSRLRLIIGLAPLLAPTIGQAVTGVWHWRAVFGVLALIGLTLVVLVWKRMPEALPTDYPVDYKFEFETGENVMRGGSMIMDPLGNALAGPDFDEETILYANVELRKRTEAHLDIDITGNYARPDVCTRFMGPRFWRASSVPARRVKMYASATCAQLFGVHSGKAQRCRHQPNRLNPRKEAIADA
jgi:hypothetical protein